MEKLPNEEARALLRQARIGVLALADDGRAYALPMNFAYDGQHVYFHAHPGLKDEFLETTKEACLSVTMVSDQDDWESVLVFGPLEKVEMTKEILEAMERMMAFPPPPEFGTSKQGEPKRSGKNIEYWRLDPTRITGRKSEHPLPPEDDVATM